MDTNELKAARRFAGNTAIATDKPLARLADLVDRNLERHGVKTAPAPACEKPVGTVEPARPAAEA